MAAPIPIAVVGNTGAFAKIIMEEFVPSFDESEIYGIGSNAGRPESERKAPRAIIICLRVPDHEAAEIENLFRSDGLSHIVVERMQWEGDEMRSVVKLQKRLNELVANGTLKNE
ncbi:hypothetical protein B0I37DRAFT_405182 [Chaetomium sp. MPI-CAGE-AT-0009]|nr:hypothetical protein B0I37DRAFT_405182 [Chaetomium sp. MPI-CAGE-AT-0009]